MARKDDLWNIHTFASFDFDKYLNFFRVSVPVVSSLYLSGREWWVLCGIERDGTVLARDDSGDETEEDIGILKEQ